MLYHLRQGAAEQHPHHPEQVGGGDESQGGGSRPHHCSQSQVHTHKHTHKHRYLNRKDGGGETNGRKRRKTNNNRTFGQHTIFVRTQVQREPERSRRGTISAGTDGQEPPHGRTGPNFFHATAQCSRCQLGCSCGQNFPCISGNCYRSILYEIRV